MIVSIICLPWLVNATTYYVDAVNGSNTNNGIANSSAFKTIQRAADVMIAGDQCLVLPGSYNERVQITKSGVLGAPIIFQAQGIVNNKGFLVVADYIHIKGFNIINDSVFTQQDTSWVLMKNGSGISIQGKLCEIVDNRIHFATYVGIALQVHPPTGTPEDSLVTSNCIIRDNIIKYAGSCGLYIQGQNHLIENNDISHSINRPSTWPITKGLDADGIRFFGSGHIYRKNYIHDILLTDPGNIGETEPHIDCIQTWGMAYNIIFEQNVFQNSNPGQQGAMIEDSSGKVENLSFVNNIFIMEGTVYLPGLNIVGVLNRVKDIKILNNTFVRTIGGGGGAVRIRNIDGIKIQNNIFYDFSSHSTEYVYTDEGYTITVSEIGYNCIYRSDGKQPSGNPYPNDLWNVNPEFLGFAKYNFKLQSNSKLIDSGVVLANVTCDKDDIPRPQGNGYDIGAYENRLNSYISTPQDLRITVIPTTNSGK